MTDDLQLDTNYMDTPSNGTYEFQLLCTKREVKERAKSGGGKVTSGCRRGIPGMETADIHPEQPEDEADCLGPCRGRTENEASRRL